MNFGRFPGTAVHVISQTTLTVTTPRHPIGQVDVHVLNGRVQSPATANDHFIFTAPTGHGTVWAWGSNLSGQFGNGTFKGQRVPVQTTGLTGVTQLTSNTNDVNAGAGGVAYAVHPAGSVYWGFSNREPDGTVENTTRYTYLNTHGAGIVGWGKYAFGVASNGQVLDARTNAPVAGLSGVKQLAIDASLVSPTKGDSSFFLYALTTSGTVLV